MNVKPSDESSQHTVSRQEFSQRKIASTTTIPQENNEPHPVQNQQAETILDFTPKFNVSPVNDNPIQIDPLLLENQYCKALVSMNPAGSSYFQVAFSDATDGNWFQPFQGLMVTNGKDMIPWTKNLVSYGFNTSGHRYNPEKHLYEYRLRVAEHPEFYWGISVGVDPLFKNVSFAKMEIRQGSPDQNFEDMPVKATLTCASNTRK